MDCPKCHAEIRPVPVPNPYWGFRDPVMTVIGAVLSLAGLFAYAGTLKQDHCPQCVARIYPFDGWRWPRMAACELASVWLNHRWYPENDLPGFIVWVSVVGIIGLVLFFASYRILPLRFDLVPQDGVLRLDL